MSTVTYYFGPTRGDFKNWLVDPAVTAGSYINLSPPPQLAYETYFRNDASNILPTGTTISSVVGHYRLVLTGGSSSYTIVAFPRALGVTGAGTNISVPQGIPGGFADFTATLAAPGTPSWSSAQIASVQLGLADLETTSLGSTLTWHVYNTGNSFGYIVVTCTLPTPTVTTDSVIYSSSTATFSGTINPNTANSDFPITYYVQYGLSAGSLTSTTATSTITGSAVTPVTRDATGLVGNTTYYYRFVGTNADNTVNGTTLSFVTGIIDPSVLSF